MEAEVAQEFNLPLFGTLSASFLHRHLTETELDLREEITLMKEDLAVVQDDTRFKRWLKQQHASAQDDFDPMDFF